MPPAATPAFHPVLRMLHWSMAALIVSMLFIGVGMVSTAGPAYSWLLSLHRPLGVAILALALVRLPVRVWSSTPALPANLPRWQARAARGSHLLLYAGMIVMPLIGWAMVSAAGKPVKLAEGIVLPAIAPHDLTLYAMLREAHGILAYALFALILAHLAAALMHGLVRRDGVLRSMLTGNA
ncbi:cytochrome b [Novosphingobium naphthalenivorans]|uniref:cytochrome b n=1 Tax=Novosphingobium naphthalenivorans TaxID=273168 RepID=UPI000A5B2892|nr:cytochrome b [Novosphingobium naphthalenivorans]